MPPLVVMARVVGAIADAHNEPPPGAGRGHVPVRAGGLSDPAVAS